MRWVINITLSNGKAHFVSSKLQLRRRKSEIIENNIVAEKSSPELDPSLISVGLRKETSTDQRVSSPARFSQFQIFLFFLVEER